MDKDFLEAVASNNVNKVRMMLSNQLLFDPRAESFSEMLAYAKENLPDLFEEEKPSRFSIPADKEQWNDDVLSEMKRDLNMNFSVEKLALYEEMAKYVGSSKAEEMEKEERERKQEELKLEEERAKKAAASRKTSGTIITGSGAVIVITGLCVKSTLLSVLGGAAVIAGVSLLVAKNKK